ncbi:MAG: hypothetical protein JWO60_1895, partial [Frankiales bacterium]|nr:hypothetical protein [Frankiales bacterium]
VGPKLWFASAAGSYAADAAADPAAATEGRAPQGSVVGTTPPTGAEPATATFVAGVQSGAPNAPTFSLAGGVAGLQAACYDVYLSSDLPQVLGLTLVSSITTPTGETISLGNVALPAYDSGVVRATALVRPDLVGKAVPAGSTLSLSSFIDGGNGLTLNYDAKTVPSSLQLNPSSCGGKAVDYTVAAPAPAGSLPTVERGLQFTAGVPSDPQRSLGEPAVTVDKEGTIYSCGPSGVSNVAEYANVSTDGGEQFHLLGQGPRGQISPGEGGGDCALASAIEKNANGDYQLAYAGLGPLTQFSTFTSPDRGRTITGSPISESVPIVDRQWIAFSDDKTAFLNYNRLLMGQTVQKSTDGGLTYGPGVTVSTDGARLGQIRAIPKGVVPGAKDAVVYFPYNAGNTVKLAMSLDNGATWSQCLAVDAGIDPTAGFVAADHDAKGNIYVSYAEKGGGRDTYLVGLTADKVSRCKGTSADSAQNNVDPGFTKKVRVNREGVETTVMPWVAASGAPGHVAVAYYGSKDPGDPDSGEFDATWHVVVSQTLDLFAAGGPQFDQVQATTHPFHYDSICLAGLNCDVAMGDRSLVDFFTMEYNQGTGRLTLVLSQTNKLPDAASGNTSTPVVLVQRSGPSNGGTTLKPLRPVVMTGTPDAAGDALSLYSSYDLLKPVTGGVLPSANVPALDVRDVRVGPEVDPATGKAVKDGGFTVRMRYADLSDAALQSALSATQSTSLVFLFRYVDGYQQSSVGAYWDPVQGFRFGRDGYTESQVSTLGTLRTYPGAQAAAGKVDQAAGEVVLSVPRSALTALTPDAKGQRPKEVPAKAGSRIYEAVAFTLANPAPLQQAQTYLYQTDNAPSFDFLLAGGTTAVSRPARGPAAAPRPEGGRLPSTGGLGLPLAALVVAGLGAYGLRRVRTTG